MKQRMVVERVGEYLGPVDWSYDFAQHDWGEGKGGINPLHREASVALLRGIANDPDQWEATTDGGAPKCGWGRVLRVGMWDGWPHWQPTPSVEISHMLGSSWHPYYALTAVRRL